jgi:hypothetical protein
VVGEQRLLQENFEDYQSSPPSNLTGQGGWTISTTGTTSATVVLRGGSNVGKFLDNDIAGKISGYMLLSFTPTTNVTPPIGTQVELEVENITGSEFVFGISRTGATTGSPATFEIALRLETGSNKVQYFTGGSWTDTGFTWTTATKYKYIIEIASTSTFFLWQGSVKKGPFNNQVTWTTLIQRLQVTTGQAATGVESYMDNIYTITPHVGFQFEAFEERGTESTVTLNANYPPAYVGGSGSDRYILVVTSGGAVRRASLASDWVSWSSAIANAQPIIVANFSGTVYSSSQVTGTLQSFSKSTDYGATFVTKAGTGSNDGKCHGMFVNPAGGSNPLYLVSRRNANTNIDIWRYDDTLNTWSTTATQAITAGGSYNNQCWGYAEGPGATPNFYVFLADDNDIAQLIAFNISLGTVAKQGNPITISGTNYHCAGDSYPLFNSDRDGQAGSVYATVINNSTGDYTLVKTDDDGATWEVVAVDVKYRFIYDRHIDSNQSDIINWVRDVENAIVGEFDTNLDHFIQRKVIGAGEAFFSEVNADSKNHVLFDQDGNDVDVYTWELFSGREVFKRTLMMQFGTQEKYTFQGSVSPATRDDFTNGDVIDIYDGFGTLALRAKLVEPRNPAERSRFILNFEGMNAEFREKHRPAETFTTKTTKQIMQSVIDARQFTYHDDSIDFNNDFTTTYTRLVQDVVANVAKFGREMENALFYTEPDGKVRMHAKARAISTGLRWSEQVSNLKLISYTTRNLIRTRSEVTGAWNQGTSDNQQIRKVYIDPDANEQLGSVTIEKSDNQIRNHTECTQMATNRYAMFGSQIQVVKLKADNFGFIQPGETIDFSWSDGRNTVPRGTFYVMKWEWDIRIDSNIIWLVDNIITEDEYLRVQTTEKQDDDLKSTFSDQSVESTADGTVITINPVGRLQAGASVWRIPEPSAADFAKGDLTNDTTWNDLDLSSIIPEGTRVVRLSVRYQTPFVGDNILFRKKGQSNAIQVDGLYSQIANKPDLRSVEVGVNESRVCQIKVDRSPSNWSQIDITVLKDEL